MYLYYTQFMFNLKKVTEKLSNLFSSKKIIDTDLELEVEKFLIEANFGNKLITKFIKELSEKDANFNAAINIFKKESLKVMSNAIKPLEIKEKPHVISICGVNGNGKTTTITKIVNYFKVKTLVAACDTFRDAAREQLESRCKIVGCDCFFGNSKDPAGIAYQALEKAKEENYELLLLDTSGRMHNNINLMEELKKIDRVVKKIDINSPHNTLLIIDATTGQNALEQIELFKKYINLTGIIITKIDNTSRAGTVLNIAERSGININLFGTGEKIDDLVYMTPEEFVEKLFSI